MIFSDYLSGLGKTAIANKLQNLGIPTKMKSKWMISTIHAILRDEKYTGDMLLQKTYRSNHLAKTKKFNTGELPQYYVEDSHDAIIPSDIFQAVQREIKRREKKYMPNVRTPVFSEYTSKIRCGVCGAAFQRKIVNAGTPYATFKWICSTYNSQGSAICYMKPIPEEVLQQLLTDVLKLDDYNPTTVAEKIQRIIIPRFGEVEFEIVGGHREIRSWKYRSRRETWKRKRELSGKG